MTDGITASRSDGEPPVKKTPRPRIRNSYENGLAWAFIVSSFRELIDALKRGGATLPGTFELPSIVTYKRHDTWLRDSLAAMLKSLEREPLLVTPPPATPE